MRFLSVILLSFMFYCSLNTLGYAAASVEPSSTDVFSNLHEGFDGSQLLTTFLPPDIQPAGVTIINKNKYDIEYQVQYYCTKTVSGGHLGVNGAYIFKKSSFTHPDKICIKTTGVSSITGSGGFTPINNIPGCVVVTIDAGFGVKNIYSKECKSEAKGLVVKGTASNSNGVWVINDNSWSVALYISPGNSSSCYVFDDLRRRLGISIDPVITPGLGISPGINISINPRDSRIVKASIGPGSAYYFEGSRKHQMLERDLDLTSPIVCVAAEGKTDFGYRFNMIGSNHPVSKKGCHITVTDKGAGAGVDLGYTGTCAPTPDLSKKAS